MSGKSWIEQPDQPWSSRSANTNPGEIIDGFAEENGGKFQKLLQLLAKKRVFNFEGGKVIKTRS